MIELLKLLPNLSAQLMSSIEKPFYSNIIYSFGYLIFIHHNIKIQDSFQLKYFLIMESIAVGGVCYHLYKYVKNKKVI